MDGEQQPGQGNYNRRPEYSQNYNQPTRQYPNYQRPYPQQPNQGYSQQQYPQYRQQYPQYPQQQYPQYPQSQEYAPPSPGGKENLIKIFVILLGVLMVGLAAWFVINALTSEEILTTKESVPTVPLVTEIEPGIRFTNNDFVFSQDVLLSRGDNAYEIGEEVILYSVFEDFEQSLTGEGKAHVEMSYGVEVSQKSTGVKFESLSNSNLVIVRKDFDSPVDDYYFTAKIPTSSLSAGEYTVIVSGKDRISGKEAQQELVFEIREPRQLKVVTLKTGEFDAEKKVFIPKTKEYYPGDVVEAFFEIRGFAVNNNTPDVVVDLYITDAEGNILRDVSKTAVYTNDITYLTKPVVMMVNLDVPTTDLNPGSYNLQILAKDKLDRISSLKKEPFTVIRRR